MKLDCSEIGMVMTIVKTGTDTQGQSLEMEWTLSPNSAGPPVHIHPSAERGEPHTFKNTTNKYVRLYNTHQPAMHFEDFFKGLHKFAKSGLVRNGKMSFRSVVGISTLWTNYPDEIISVQPPSFVMKALGALGRMTGTNFK